MNFQRLPIYLGFLVLSLTTQAQLIRRIDGSRISVDSLEAKINHLMNAAQVSGVAISVFNANQPVYSQTFGLADVPNQKRFLPTSVMYAASFAKTLFAYIVMQHVQEKTLDLDRPLVTYLSKPLPDYQIPGWRRGYQDLKDDPRYEKITARMCLTHTTGFPNWRWFEADKKIKFKFDPGARYSYSGEGLYLLQFVLEQITGVDLETMAQNRVFKPLGMKSTSFVWQPRFEEDVCLGHSSEGIPYELVKWPDASAGGSMSTTLEDYTRFYTHLIQGKGLSRKSFRDMTQTQIRIRSKRQFGPLALVDGPDQDAIQLGYGLGVGTLQSPHGPAFFKEGHDDGWGHYCISFPKQKVALIIMTNNDTGESIFKELLAFAIGDIYTPWEWENYIPFDSPKD